MAQCQGPNEIWNIYHVPVLMRWPTRCVAPPKRTQRSYRLRLELLRAGTHIECYQEAVGTLSQQAALATAPQVTPGDQAGADALAVGAAHAFMAAAKEIIGERQIISDVTKRWFTPAVR